MEDRVTAGPPEQEPAACCVQRRYHRAFARTASARLCCLATLLLGACSFDFDRVEIAPPSSDPAGGGGDSGPGDSGPGDSGPDDASSNSPDSANDASDIDAMPTVTGPDDSGPSEPGPLDAPPANDADVADSAPSLADASPTPDACVKRTEVCNGTDDDCNGKVDDLLVVSVCTVPGQKGECAKGNNVCRNGQSTCVASRSAVTESCDGLDNDCDGLTDELNSNGCALYGYDRDGDAYFAEIECLCSSQRGSKELVPVLANNARETVRPRDPCDLMSPISDWAMIPKSPMPCTPASWDWDHVRGLEPQWTAAGSCVGDAIGCHTNFGWDLRADEAIPECGAEHAWVRDCENNGFHTSCKNPSIEFQKCR